MTPMSPKEKGNLWLGLAGVSFVLAAVSYLSPPTSPASGRWAWLHNVFSGLFGAASEVILFAAVGGIGLLIALSNYREAQKGNPHA